jgi:hypothetical protein
METLAKTPHIEGGLVVMGNPKHMLKQAQEVADLLMEVVEKQNLFMKIGTSTHIYVTAWQFLAHFYGISAKVTSVDPYIDEMTGAAGFKATADAIMMTTGMVISSGSAICLNTEANWSLRPKYEWKVVPGVGRTKVQVGEEHVPSFQLYSMASTRAVGKALSNVLRFVVMLAGFDPTPAEEMTGNERTSDDHDQRQPNEKPSGREPERKSTQQPVQQTLPVGNGAAGVAGPITEGQLKRMHAIRKECGCPTNTMGQIIIGFGFDIAANVTKARYDEVVAAIQNWNTPKAG